MTRIAPLKLLDVSIIEDVLEMGGGYVLDFSDKTFARFFEDEIGVFIDQEKYLKNGTSKANRLRTYLRSTTNEQRFTVLTSLWEYREYTKDKGLYSELNPKTEARFLKLLESLKSNQSTLPDNKPKEPAPEPVNASGRSILMANLIETTACKPHRRGYQFEKFLKDFFTAYGLQPRGAFSLSGEQIDGSFIHDTHTYLLEAKWTSAQINAETLRGFDAKVRDKADWSRGLFVSQTGFTDVGLEAFGRGKRIVCMDGLDIADILQGMTTLNNALVLKVRNAAETGRPFVRVRDLV